MNFREYVKIGYLGVRRNFQLARTIESGYLLYCLCCVSKLPFFNLNIINDPRRTNIKNKLKDNELAVGHSLSWRIVKLCFFGIGLIARTLREGLISTAFQFYLNRPLHYLVKFLNTYPEITTALRFGIVFDPGCGCGKHLLYLRDRFNCEIIGVDIYKPAIDVANIVDFKNEGCFLLGSVFDPDIFWKELPDQIDVLLIDSWLKHVEGHPKLNTWFKNIIPKTKYALINIGRKEEALFTKFFGKYKILSQLDAKESNWYFIDLTEKTEHEFISV